MYFDPDTTGWPSRPSIGYQDWSPAVAAEAKAVAETAGLLDQSMYAKLLVAGPDGLAALDRVSGARMDVGVGANVYTQFLNPRGGIEADVTVTRLAHDRFMVVTGHPAQVRDAEWIKRNAEPGWNFDVVDMTSAYSLLSVHGPRSRDILQAVSGDDLSNAALPFGAAREIDLAFARAWVIRRSFLGELGYEFLVPSEFTAHVFEALMEAGKPHGLRHIGMFAMNSCRIEKGFRHMGHDIAESDTPFESGLGFAVDLDKPDFLGKDGLAEQKKTFGAATPDRLVSVAVPGLNEKDGPYLMHNETIWKDGGIVGYVTSGGWGHRLGRMVGLASLHLDDGVRDDWIKEGGFSVRIAGADFPAEVQLKPFYDPDGARMRG